jgi:hypothetical protein
MNVSCESKNLAKQLIILQDNHIFTATKTAFKQTTLVQKLLTTTKC